jgi:hypothetical protein
MITRSGRFLQIPGKKWCTKCNEITDQTCFHIAYWKSEKSDDACEKSERWNCNRCHTDDHPKRRFKFVCSHQEKHTEKRAPAKNRGATSSRQRFYLIMSTIFALEALVFTDSTPFMQPSFDS